MREGDRCGCAAAGPAPDTALAYEEIRTSRTSGIRILMCAWMADEKVAGETSQSGQPPVIATSATPSVKSVRVSVQ